MKMNDKLPEPGTGVHGERLSPLPTNYKTGSEEQDAITVPKPSTVPPKGAVHHDGMLDPVIEELEQLMSPPGKGQDQIAELVAGAVGSALGNVLGAAGALASAGVSAAGNAIIEGEKMGSPGNTSSEDSFGASARPVYESAADTWARKHGGQK